VATMIGYLLTQALAFLAVFVYATHATQTIAFEWKPGISLARSKRQTLHWNVWQSLKIFTNVYKISWNLRKIAYFKFTEGCVFHGRSPANVIRTWNREWVWSLDNSRTPAGRQVQVDRVATEKARQASTVLCPKAKVQFSAWGHRRNLRGHEGYRYHHFLDSWYRTGAPHFSRWKGEQFAVICWRSSEIKFKLETKAMTTSSHCNLIPIIHYQKRTHFPIYTRCSENHITIIPAQKIAVWNLILCSGASWRQREKIELGVQLQIIPYKTPKNIFLTCTA